MTTFTNFQEILPSPTYGISYAGDSNVSNDGHSYGPGYSSVQLTSKQPVLKDMTNSGRLLARTNTAHSWDISISYNPMTRSEFEPVYAFLLQRLGALNPFYVSLPQYRNPKDTAFSAYNNSSQLEAAGSYAAGATSVLIGKTGYSNTTNGTPTNGTPQPGDLFNIDGSNSNHKKAYMVTRVETSTDYQSGTTAPTSSQVRIHFTPGLQKAISTADAFVFKNPLIRVVQSGDVQEYSLNTNNLYSFSLKLEEVQ